MMEAVIRPDRPRLWCADLEDERALGIAITLIDVKMMLSRSDAYF